MSETRVSTQKRTRSDRRSGSVASRPAVSTIAHGRGQKLVLGVLRPPYVGADGIGQHHRQKRQEHQEERERPSGPEIDETHVWVKGRRQGRPAPVQSAPSAAIFMKVVS